MGLLCFSEFVISEMNKRLWSRSELSRETGLPKSTVSKVLNGRVHPTYNMCKQIALVFYQTPGIDEDQKAQDAWFLELSKLMDESRKHELAEADHTPKSSTKGSGELQRKILRYIYEHPYETVIQISLGMDKPSGLIGKTLSGLFYGQRTFEMGGEKVKLHRRKRGTNKTKEYWID